LSLRLAATRDVPQIDQAEWDISEEQGIVRARRLSQATMRNIRENLSSPSSTTPPRRAKLGRASLVCYTW
jgi:hypothetical protein